MERIRLTRRAGFEIIHSKAGYGAGYRRGQGGQLIRDFYRIFRSVKVRRSRRLEYSALKSLVREDFLKHPRGHQLEIQEFDLERLTLDLERTITFGEAMNRVSELYPFVNDWKAKLRSLQDLRNNVVHYGSSAEQSSEYADGIAIVAFPFLHEFLMQTNGISLEAVVTATVYRELDVARKVCERLRQEQQSGTYVLRTVGHVMLYTYVEWPKPIDKQGFVVENWDANDDMAYEMRKEVTSAWNECYIEDSCRVCGSTFFVGVELLTPPIRAVKVIAAKCPVCGLDIRRDETHLAEYHVGELTQQKIEEFLKGIGYGET